MDRYYDAVLGLIPLTFVSIAAALAFFGFGTATAVTGGSVVAVGLVGHAMFINAPVDARPTDAGRSASTDAGHQTAD